MIITNGIYQIGLFALVLSLVARPLGWYIIRVYEGQSCGLNFFLGPLERFTYRLARIDLKEEMTWKGYLTALLLFNLIGFIFVLLIQILQGVLPYNPQHFSSVSLGLALNTAMSFITNTNWQAYGGETTLSYLTQSLALTVQNFLSAATGMAVLVALIRGLVRRETDQLGNFWIDIVRGTLYIFLPLSIIFSLYLVFQGVVQNFKPYQRIELIQPFTYRSTASELDSRPIAAKSKFTPENKRISTQILPMGPVASQVAIKQLGSNGGGYFNTNSAHPFENPTPWSNFFELLAMLLIPAALCYTFGYGVRDLRQGRAILFTMFIFFLPMVFITTFLEQQPNPELVKLGIHSTAQADYSGGNLEGKEIRFGILGSALWTTAAASSSNGAVNSMLDSYTPLGGLVPLWLMHLGEVIFGGVGSGLYGMLIFVMVAVFIAGLIVGRTPEYLGKKIEPYEMRLIAIVMFAISVIPTIFSALAVISPSARAALGNPGPHGLTEILYAFTSMFNNNGSAFSGLSSNTLFFNGWGVVVMCLGRFGIIAAVLAIAGSMAKKKVLVVNAGTLPTHTLLFIISLVLTIIIIGTLTILPSVALGPIVEHLMFRGH